MKPNAPPSLRPVVFSLLLELNEGPRHGYALMKRVNDRMGHRAITGAGTLYRTLKELRDSGWIEYVEGPEGEDARRQYYALSDAGRQAARTEATRLEKLVLTAREGGLLPDAGSGR